MRVLPRFAGLACKPVGAVLLPHAVRAALRSTTTRISNDYRSSEPHEQFARQTLRGQGRTSCNANRCSCKRRQGKE